MTLTLLSNLTALLTLLPGLRCEVTIWAFYSNDDQITAAFDMKSDNPYWMLLSKIKYINIQHIFL